MQLSNLMMESLSPVNFTKDTEKARLFALSHRVADLQSQLAQLISTLQSMVCSGEVPLTSTQCNASPFQPLTMLGASPFTTEGVSANAIQCAIAIPLQGFA